VLDNDDPPVPIEKRAKFTINDDGTISVHPKTVVNNFGFKAENMCLGWGKKTLILVNKEKKDSRILYFKF